ncbi:hypothetical protein CERSUDRAFT_111198 [Gelatoporia subvermispora B]|uniref:Uncharacterized protein n=1 Tax=Ceriporiopsis subvermispora (strain B) TaxID=914234 RepID=M2RP34_CERS8|nr:hypothetical protein CERSUDRAFT_111198 [Gelatoporia subvermispora B]
MSKPYSDTSRRMTERRWDKDVLPMGNLGTAKAVRKKHSKGLAGELRRMKIEGEWTATDARTFQVLLGDTQVCIPRHRLRAI